jgi:undecaprenyl-diphosphatase
MTLPLVATTLRPEAAPDAALPEPLTAFVLGLIEGATEFIPVSSTGHLLLAGHFLGFESAGRTFVVVIQLGAVLAILAVYLGKIVHIFATAPTDPASRRYIGAVLLAFFPAAFLGVLLYDVIKTVFFETPHLIAWMLILGGVLLLLADRFVPEPRYKRPNRIPLRTAFAIGLFQCLALVPGVSRSGATIVGALMLGVSKRAAAEFSFFLSLPTMGGAVAYDLWSNRDVLSFDDMGLIAIGFATAFVSGVVVVRWLLGFVSRHGYALFGWWRILVGGAALAFLSLGF